METREIKFESLRSEAELFEKRMSRKIGQEVDANDILRGILLAVNRDTKYVNDDLFDFLRGFCNIKQGE